MVTAIVLVSVFVLIALFFYYASKSGAKMEKERDAKLSRAEAGKAKIIGFNMVGLRGTGSQGEYQAYRFTLEVTSAYKSAYQTRSVWNVFPMGAPKVQEGSEVDVKIDADDQTVIYPIVQGVEYSWMGSIIKER
jgi:hypothetical protein